MSKMGELETSAFAIIAAVGTARSSYIEAIHEAAAGDIDAARALVLEGKKAFLGGHDAHMSLIQKEAAGDPCQMNLILTHAEDQLMSAEGFGILAEEFINLYEQLHRSHVLASVGKE